MNSLKRNGNSNPNAALSPAEQTLRLIATLPAPDGLADRVQQSLRNAPRSARVLYWPSPRTWMSSAAVRGAAAAAIVCVVAAGGWRIYSRVPSAPSARVIEMPLRAPAAGGFSSANARRVPDTLQGPELTHIKAPDPQPVRLDAAKKSAPSPGHAADHRADALPARPVQ